MVARQRTDDGGWTMGGTGHRRGAAEYTFMDGEEAERTNGERRRARCAEEQGARRNLGGGGERKEPKSSRTGNIESLKIGTESRSIHSLCSGMELHQRTNGERRRARCAEEQGARRNLGGGLHDALPISRPRWPWRWGMDDGGDRTPEGGG